MALRFIIPEFPNAEILKMMHSRGSSDEKQKAHVLYSWAFYSHLNNSVRLAQLGGGALLATTIKSVHAGISEAPRFGSCE